MNTLFSRIFSILVALLSCQAVVADETGVEKYRNYLPEQIKELSDAIRGSEMPFMYTQATNTALAPWATDLFAIQLNTLFYSGIGNYEGAILAFQKDVGDPPTGRLTVWQIFQLNYRSEMKKVSPPHVVQNFISGKTAVYAFVDGTATILDERSAFPINYVKVRCYKDNGYCRLDQLDVQPPTETDWVYDFTMFWQDPVFYNVTTWSEDVVQAEHGASGEACRSTTIDLNFKTKEFYMITKNTGRDCEIFGQKLDRLKRPRISQIVDGTEIIAAEHQAFKQKAFTMVSSEFRARIEKHWDTE